MTEILIGTGTTRNILTENVAHELVGSSSCPIGWMGDLYELARDADKILTFELT